MKVQSTISWVPSIDSYINSPNPEKFAQFMRDHFGKNQNWLVYDDDRKFLTKHKDDFPREIKEIILALNAHPMGVLVRYTEGHE